MKIPLFVLLALLVTAGSTNGVSRRPILASKQLCIVQSNPSNGSCCVCIAGRLIFATKWARVKRSRRGEVSVSPNTDGLSSPPPSMSNTTITSRNGADTQPPPNIPSWLPTFEDIVTTVYRVVLLLFNLNITMTLRYQAHQIRNRLRLGRDQNNPRRPRWPA